MSLMTIANRAGVSKATVSRVINQQGNVHPDTVRLVRRAIDEVGYRPTFPRKGRPKELGDTSTSLAAFALVLPEVSGGLYLSLQEGFATAASEDYHQIMVCNTDNDVYKQADQILQLMHKRVAGVAMVTATSAATPPHHVQMLQKSGIPVVLLHREVPGVRAPLVHLPLEEVGYMAGKALIESGHQRIAIFPTTANQSGLRHFSGFERALQEAGLQPTLLSGEPEKVAPMTPENEAVIRRMVERMWALPAAERPTALFVTFDSLAELVYLQLMQMGVRVPEDLSIVTFGGNYRLGPIAKRLTCVTVDEAHAGEIAVQLFSQIRGGVKSIDAVEQIELPLKLMEGATLSAPASSIR